MTQEEKQFRKWLKIIAIWIAVLIVIIIFAKALVSWWVLISGAVMFLKRKDYERWYNSYFQEN